MALFEMHDGRLAPAQLGTLAATEVQAEALHAVRQQIVEVTRRPLFSINWQNQDGHDILTALDPSGQVVTVEVTRTLDSATVVGAMARLADTSSAGWTDLASQYPGGIETFREDWNEFREALPARVEPGPRLIIVTTEFADDVRSSLTVLLSSGIEVHHLTVRDLDGQQVVDVERAEADLFRSDGPLLMARPARVALEAAPTEEMDLSAVETTEPDTQEEQDSAPAEEQSDAPATLEIAGAESEAAFAAVAGVLDQPTTVVWQQLRENIFHEATIDPQGTLTLEDQRSFTDPNLAADAAHNTTGNDGWQCWRFGPTGPSLREALEEIIAAEERRANRKSDSSKSASRAAHHSHRAH